MSQEFSLLLLVLLSCAVRPQVVEDGGAMQELQLLVQSLTKKVGEAEERYSLLQEQTDSLKELLVTEKEQYSQKETMYKQNVGDPNDRSHAAVDSFDIYCLCLFVLDPDIQRHHHSERQPADGGQPAARAGALQAGSKVRCECRLRAGNDVKLTNLSTDRT